jgi:hypothetical protein
MTHNNCDEKVSGQVLYLTFLSSLTLTQPAVLIFGLLSSSLQIFIVDSKKNKKTNCHNKDLTPFDSPFDFIL